MGVCSFKMRLRRLGCRRVEKTVLLRWFHEKEVLIILLNPSVSQVCRHTICRCWPTATLDRLSDLLGSSFLSPQVTAASDEEGRGERGCFNRTPPCLQSPCPPFMDRSRIPIQPVPAAVRTLLCDFSPHGANEIHSIFLHSCSSIASSFP